jgi:3-oxoacyl-[acyl-carrier-protein] synthase III
LGINISSTGSSLGSLEVYNHEISRNTGVSEAEILLKTGIVKRNYLDPRTETLLTLSSTAAKRAIAKINVTDFDLVVAATYGHDFVYPSLASRVCKDLDLSANLAIDVQSNCTGFVNSLLIANDKLIADESAFNALIIASEANSLFMDPTDSNTALFWGDGSGALTLNKNNLESGGLIARAHSGNFKNNDAVRLEWELGAITGTRVTKPIHQDGLATWRQATSGLPLVIQAVLRNANLEMTDIDFFVFHQANLRMLEYLAAKLKIDPAKVPINVDRIGNMGAASIPILLDELVSTGALEKGCKILFASVGAGFTFSSLIWEW